MLELARLVLRRGVVAVGLWLAAEPVERVPSVPRLPSAAEQLALARRRRSRLSAAQDGRAELERVLAAYDAVRVHHPRSEEAREAMFRRGELLRSRERWTEARESFAWVRCHGGETLLAFRARLQACHVLRRAGRGREAAHGYLALWQDGHAPAQIRDRAARWRAEMLVRAGDRSGARTVWRVLAATARDPRDRVLACRALLRACVGEACEERCDESVRRRLRELETIARERTERGARVRRELDRCRE